MCVLVESNHTSELVIIIIIIIVLISSCYNYKTFQYIDVLIILLESEYTEKNNYDKENR